MCPSGAPSANPLVRGPRLVIWMALGRSKGMTHLGRASDRHRRRYDVTTLSETQLVGLNSFISNATALIRGFKTVHETPL